MPGCGEVLPLLPGEPNIPRTAFETHAGLPHRAHLVAASIITLFGTFVLIGLQGWWSLSRTVSPSLLETAKAFSECDNNTADKILDRFGGIQVKYVDGVME